MYTRSEQRTCIKDVYRGSVYRAGRKFTEEVYKGSVQSKCTEEVDVILALTY